MNPKSEPVLPNNDPVSTLCHRLREELSADFRAERPIRLSRAPGRLDVMGGIADYTGSLVCELPLDRAAAVAIKNLYDRLLHLASFNLLDERKPFDFRMPLDALAAHSAQSLARELDN